MMWDILPDISFRETGGSTLCTRAATVGNYSLLSFFSWPTLHSDYAVWTERWGGTGCKNCSGSIIQVLFIGKNPPKRTWEESLLNDVLTRSPTPKPEFESGCLLAETSEVVFTAAGKWENSFCGCTKAFKKDKQQFGLFTLALQLTDLYPSRVQCTNAAWNRTPDVALLSPVALAYAVPSPHLPLSRWEFLLFFI